MAPTTPHSLPLRHKILPNLDSPQNSFLSRHHTYKMLKSSKNAVRFPRSLSRHLQEKASTSHVYDVIGVLREPFFSIHLLRKKVKVLKNVASSLQSSSKPLERAVIMTSTQTLLPVVRHCALCRTPCTFS